MTPSSQAVAMTAASPAAATRTSGPAATGLRRIARGDTKTLTGTIPASSNGGIDYCPLRSVDESETEDSEDGSPHDSSGSEVLTSLEIAVLI